MSLGFHIRRYRHVRGAALSARIVYGVTLVEIVVVLAIIAILLGLLFPAVHRARESARRAQCQHNLHQMAIAMVHFAETRKRLPDPNMPSTIGGWAIAILPFMEDANLGNGLSENPPLDPAQPLRLACMRPAIMACPSAYEGDSTIATVPPSHYGAVFIRTDRKLPWMIGELPIDSRLPWVASPEGGIGGEESLRPHNGGYSVVSGNGRYSHGVRFIGPDGPATD